MGEKRGKMIKFERCISNWKSATNLNVSQICIKQLEVSGLRSFDFQTYFSNGGYKPALKSQLFPIAKRTR